MAANFLCGQVIRDCPCQDDPISNFSSEEPDRPVFIGQVNWGDPPPLNQFFIDPACLGFCYSFESQEEADLCALREAQLCVWNGYGPPGIPTYPNDPPDFGPRAKRGHFANTEQSCTIECVDGTMHTEIVEAGTVLALTQAEADEKAHALACKRASHRTICFLTDTLPPGCVGQAYSTLFQAQGGTYSYTFAVVAGSLPAGLALADDGTLSGIPGAAGTASFDVEVTDSDGNTQTKTFSLTVITCGVTGCTTPAVPDSPSDLTVPDNTIVDTIAYSLSIPFTPNTDYFFAGTPDYGVYRIEYVNGAAHTQAGGIPPHGEFFWVNDHAPFSSDSAVMALWDSGFGMLDEHLMPPFDYQMLTYYYATQADCEAGLAGIYLGFDQLTTNQVGFRVKYTYSDTIDGVPNPTWQLRRIAKLATTPPARLRIKPADFAVLVPVLIPTSGTWVGIGTVWDGTCPEFDATIGLSNLIWRTPLVDTQLNGFAIYPALTKVYHDLNQSTPTFAAWILAVTFNDGGGGSTPWIGFGGNGTDPVGDYVFTPVVDGWTLTGRKSDVRLATTAPCAGCIQVGLDLVALSNGPLPAIDGVAPVLGDRVLIKDDAEKNGIYTVTSLGSASTKWRLSRTADSISQGIWCKVTEGSFNGGCWKRLITVGPINLGVTDQDWSQIPIVLRVESY